MLSITPDIGHKKRDRGSRRAWTGNGSEGVRTSSRKPRAVPAARRSCFLRKPRPVPAAPRFLFPAPLAALRQPPLADPRVIAGDQDLGHLVPAPLVRARVVRVLRSALERLAERLLDRAVLVAERAR